MIGELPKIDWSKEASQKVMVKLNDGRQPPGQGILEMSLFGWVTGPHHSPSNVNDI